MGFSYRSKIQKFLTPISDFVRKFVSGNRKMGRILAIDFGLKRTGLAVTDTGRIIATALDTVPTAEIIPFLKKYTSGEQVDCFVVGLPMRMNFKAPEISTHINAFVKKLRKEFPGISIERYDERFTSSIAFQSMIDAGLTKKARRDKALVDKISATIILQSYLEHSNNKKTQE
jgi:putative holliday junction resolvase